MATKKSKRFPTVLYVYWDNLSADDAVLIACESPDEAVSVGQKTLLGVYSLDKTVMAYGEARIEEV